ncbi:MAG: tetratricopeptide repeat protein [Anaerolineae bacterium]|nr:tetratricopeptide repeat protein [Anaerolineae bacterium]
MDERLHIYLLGEFSVSQGDQLVRGLNAERPQSLLAYLLLHRHTPVSRQRLAYTFWPDSAEEQARTNLRNLLHTLRRTLPNADRWLQIDTHTVQWCPEADYKLDVADFQAASQASTQTQDAATCRQALETAVSLYKGSLLPGNYDDWLIPIREELQQTYQENLRHLVHLLAEMDEHETAVYYARLLQREDPLAETAVILLMQLYTQLRDQTALRRAYYTYTTALRQELDAEPSLDLQTTFATALQRVDTADSLDETEPAPPARRTSPRQSPHLPPQPTPFIGREVELAKLAERLAEPHCRLLTIVGLGGTGKTRLALQSAYGHVTVFTDGAAFIPLASVTDPLILPSAIAHGLGFNFSRASSPSAQLLHHLADKEQLLVLDNMEQLGENVTFLAELLAAAPNVKLLITSRRRLQLQEEWVLPLHGLPLPSQQNLADMPTNNAVALFVQAAQQHDPNFVPNAKMWPAIRRICQLVDGLPLGLELAAPWIRLLSCAEIAAEIEKNLDFLTSSQLNVPERHRSIRAVFNQSWEMLTPTEQQIFACLSLFVGGFSREGAEQVADANLLELSGLLDKSLVRRLSNGRYDSHELLRQYAATQLETLPTHTAAHTRFAAYYVTLAETAVAYLTSPDQQTWLDTLDNEYDNLRAALNWSVQNNETETAVRLGAALGRYWWLRYRPIEGGNWLRQILALPGSQTAHRARAMSYAGMLARLRRDYAEAETYLTACIDYQQQTGDKLDLGRSLNELGMLYLDQGEFAQAQPLFEEWLILARHLKSAHGISIALLNLGMVMQHQGHLNQAEAYYQESLTLSRKLGLLTNVAMLLNSYGMLLLDQNRLGPAGIMFLESMQLNLDLGHKDGLAWTFLGLLTLHHLADQAQTAAQLVGVQETLRRELGTPLPPASQLHFEQIIHELQQRLSIETFDTQQQHGQAMSLNEAIQLVQNGVDWQLE